MIADITIKLIDLIYHDVFLLLLIKYFNWNIELKTNSNVIYRIYNLISKAL